MFGRKEPLLFIPVILILFIVFIVPPYKLVPLKSNFLSLSKGPLFIFYRTYLVFFDLVEIVSFYPDYKKMQKEMGILRFKMNQLREQRIENIRLRKILRLKEKETFNFVSAQVIGKEPSNWFNCLIINKGSNEGICINQPVMTFFGLIGKVIEVTPEVAKVLLISDVNSRVVAQVQRTREEGILEGIGRGLCQLKYLNADAQVKVGDVVITAGVGGVYPKGLIIGKISSIRDERGGMYKNCTVKPEKSLFGLEEVLCLEVDSEP